MGREAGDSELLRKITLACKGIGDDHCETIAKCLKDPECKCEALYLNDNNIRHKGAEELAKALETNTKLTELSLAYNNIGDTGLGHLLDALSKNRTLHKLELGCCHLGENESKAKKNAAAGLCRW